MLDNRVGEQWPTANLGRDVETLPQTPTEEHKTDVLRRAMAPPPIPDQLAISAGVNDVKPITDQELLKWIIENDMTAPYQPFNPRR